MTERAVQAYETLWINYDEIDPADDNTDWKTNLQVAPNEGGFTITALDNKSKEIVVHYMSQDQMMSLVRWLRDGPD